MNWKPAFWSSIIGAILGATSTILISYWVTYKNVELPKMELEARKASVEVHKLALSLSPNINVSCISGKANSWKWKVTCTSKNKGIYHTNISIDDVKIMLSFDSKESLYRQGGEFKIEFPNNEQNYLAAPNTEGDIWFYIAFNQEQYPKGYDRNDLKVRITYAYKTIDSATNYVIKQFPELSLFVDDISKNGTNFYLPLRSDPTN